MVLQLVPFHLLPADIARLQGMVLLKVLLLFLDGHRVPAHLAQRDVPAAVDLVQLKCLGRNVTFAAERRKAIS